MSSAYRRVRAAEGRGEAGRGSVLEAARGRGQDAATNAADDKKQNKDK